MKRLLLALILLVCMTGLAQAQSWRHADNHPSKRFVTPPRAQVHYAQPRVYIQVTPMYRYRTPACPLHFGPHYNTQPYLYTPRVYYGWGYYPYRW